MRVFHKITAAIALALTIALPAAGQKTIISDRITAAPDDTNVVRLAGNTPLDARVASDRGAVEDSLPLNRMLMVLKRAPEQEAALEKFMDEQLDPASANFHHWLEPEELATSYGHSTNDLRAITGWLQSYGFTVDEVSKGQILMWFSGTAGQVRNAFHTEIHAYVVDGVQYYSNSTDPSIPAALAPAVVGITKLNNFPERTAHTAMRPVQSDAGTGKWHFTDSPANAGAAAQLPGAPGQDTVAPAYIPPSNSIGLLEMLGPYDFATIYNVLPLWNAGIKGNGQTIAIAGDSDINLNDVATFRSFFGLPKNPPTKIFNGTSPGYTGARVENSLDVEWSGAVAPEAAIKLVVTADKNGGPFESAFYIIENKIASIMSMSYEGCELGLGTTLNAGYNALWQEAAVEGITAFVASGDQGSSMCDVTQGELFAQEGLAVNGEASTPYNIAVGGTDFNWYNLGRSKYWHTTNNPTYESSAIGYIPEIPWNNSCASAAIEEAYLLTKLGLNAPQSCEYVWERYIEGYSVKLLTVVGGGGGVSACTTPTGKAVSNCAGGWPAPAWQKSLPTPAGVASKEVGHRYVPDVALFAADGALLDAYVICDSESYPCDFKNGDIAFQSIGGTSVASPAMAGIMALVNQKMGTPQGNAGKGLYALAALDRASGANCKSDSVSAVSKCNFNDISTDTNSQPCPSGSPNCYAPNGYQVGVLTEYGSTAGYDLTTGLGSVNAANLVDNWHLVGSTAVPVLEFSPTSLAFASTAVGSTSAAKTITISNSGNAPLQGIFNLIGADPSSFIIGAGTCPAQLAAHASCTLDVKFKPAAKGALSATLSYANNGLKAPAQIPLKGTGT